MREELEMYLDTLKAGLEVEVDLFGSRTPMACALRRSIIETEKELSSLKAGGVTKDTTD